MSTPDTPSTNSPSNASVDGSGNASNDLAVPGVYLEPTPLPPGFASVATTAVPVFIGYTEKAADPVTGQSHAFEPVEIRSLADYEDHFGRYAPRFLISEAAPGGAFDFTAQMWNGAAVVPVKYLIGAVPLGGGARRAQNAFHLYNSIRLFYANGGGTCYVVSVGQNRAGSVKLADLQKGLEAEHDHVGPTITLVPDAVLLPADAPAAGARIPTSQDFTTLTRAMLAQCGELQDRVALLDVYGTDAIESLDPDQRAKDIAECITRFQADYEVAGNDYGAAYFPLLAATVVWPEEFDFRNLAAFPGGIAVLQDILTNEASALHPDASAPDLNPVNNKNRDFLRISGRISQMTAGPSADPAAIAALNRELTATVPLLRRMINGAVAKANLLPPNGAIAGIYAANDAALGVWSAPANITVNAISAPSVPIDDKQQGQMNAPDNGHAVNAIREFAGYGTLVWGARTLDANSADWRYIQVRRTIVYIEQSIKTALNGYVFAANDAQTWTAVTQAISSFLTDLWSKGALFGAGASDAFTVQCGLGTSMTEEDILDGYMKVQVTLAIVAPAEFIALSFTQTMQAA